MTVAIVANIARPISSAISAALSADSYGLLSSYGLLGAAANPDAVIEALFANSEVGAWYDPSDLSTMFQDSAGLVPTTADGQPVGLILDKSGRGNHAFQATAASRPLYKTDGTYHWLEFDGVDDSLSTATFTAISASPLWTATIGLYRYSQLDQMMLCSDGASRFFGVAQIGTESSSNAVGDSTFRANGVAVPGAPSTSRGQLNDAIVDLASKVITAKSLTMTDWVTFSPLWYVSSDFVAQLRMYSFILRGAASTTQEITDTETWVAGKTGVTL
jgi:hypothetical protein